MNPELISKLPRKPSELIRLAVSDLVKVEKDSKYKIDMNYWHSPSADGKCEVCLAGAVLAKSCKFDPKEEVTVGDFEYASLGIKLKALDRFRQSYIAEALATLGYSEKIVGSLHFSIFEIKIPDYSDDPKTFKSKMRLLAKRLEQEGL